MLDKSLIEQANQTDIVALAKRYVPGLRRCTASGEECGSCPFCTADENGFHVHPKGWWKCYTCHQRPSKAVDLYMRLENTDFVSAVLALTGGTLDQSRSRDAERATTRSPPTPAKAWDETKGQQIMASASDLLWGAAGTPANLNASINCATWLNHRLGFRPDLYVGVSCTVPAIAMPWYAGGKLVAIRYRLLAPRNGQRLRSEPGSTYSGKLFGGHAMIEPASTLVLVKAKSTPCRSGKSRSMPACMSSAWAASPPAYRQRQSNKSVATRR